LVIHCQPQATQKKWRSAELIVDNDGMGHDDDDVQFSKIQYFFKVLKTDFTIQYFFNTAWQPCLQLNPHGPKGVNVGKEWFRLFYM